MKKVGKILAEGEATGHAHYLLNTEALEREDGVREFDVLDKDIVKHEEHKEIELPANKYASDKVVEFDHFEMESRKVQD